MNLNSITKIWNKNVPYSNTLKNCTSKSYRQAILKKGFNKLDVRIEVSFQETSGSTYERLPFKIDCFKEAIKNDEYDAQIIFINNQKIPQGFIDYLVDKIREDRFIYIKVCDTILNEAELQKQSFAISEKLFALIEMENSIKNDLVKAKSVIGLKGPKTVGKSYVANKMIAQLNGDAEVLSYATPIKNIVHGYMNDGNSEELMKYAKYLSTDSLLQIRRLLETSNLMDLNLDNKELIRPYYQEVGDICRSQNKDFFIDIMRDEIASSQKGTVIIDDVRYINECQLCSKVYDIYREGVNYTEEHSSERNFNKEEKDLLKVSNISLLRYHNKKD